MSDKDNSRQRSAEFNAQQAIEKSMQLNKQAREDGTHHSLEPKQDTYKVNKAALERKKYVRRNMNRSEVKDSDPDTIKLKEEAMIDSTHYRLVKSFRDNRDNLNESLGVNEVTPVAEDDPVDPVQ